MRAEEARRLKMLKDMEQLDLSAEVARRLKDFVEVEYCKVLEMIEDAALNGFANVFLGEKEHLGKKERMRLMSNGYHLKLHGTSHGNTPKWEIKWVDFEEENPLYEDDHNPTV